MERLFFNRFITKDLTATDSDRRLFEGILTVEMVDKQNEITVVNHLMKVLPIWMARGGPITDTHSNRVVGRGVNFAKTTVTDSDGTIYPAISIQGEIHKDYDLDHEIWNAIKSGKYKGLSFGGATKADRTPIRNKDGSVSYALTDLEHYEVAVCEDPAVPLALITQSNQIAKSMAGNWSDRGNGNICIKCDRFGCHVNKVNQDAVTGADNDEFEKATIPESHPDGNEWSEPKADTPKPHKQDITPLQDNQWRGEDSQKGNYHWGAPKQPNDNSDASRDENLIVGKDDEDDDAHDKKKEHGNTFSGTGEEGGKERVNNDEPSEAFKEDKNKILPAIAGAAAGILGGAARAGAGAARAGGAAFGSGIDGEDEEKAEGATMSTTTDGVNNPTYNEDRGKKKEHLANTTVDGVRTGTGGYSTAEQGPADTAQVTNQEVKPTKSKKKSAVLNIGGKLFYVEG